MAGRNPNEAFQNYLAPVHEALQCITQERLTLRERRRLAIDTPYSVTLNDMDPVLLKGTPELFFAAGQILRIESSDAADRRGPFQVRTLRYLYRFLVVLDDRGVSELLAFHWTPEANGSRPIRFPHLHVGPALLAGQSAIRRGDLHKAHIPTGPVALAAVVRLAIAEFGVAPLRADWAEVLQRAEESPLL